MPHVPDRSRLTNAIIKRAEYDGRAHCVLWDDAAVGLGLRVRESGRKVWIVRYRDPDGENRRKTLGDWSEREAKGKLTLPEARREAAKLLGSAAAGGIEREERRAAVTVSTAWPTFIESRRQRGRSPKTITQYENHFTNWIEPAIGRRRIAAVVEADVVDLHESLGEKRTQANRVLATLSSLMSYAERKGWRPKGSNPCIGLEIKHAEKPAERTLTRDEQAALMDALDREEHDARKELRELPRNRKVESRDRICSRLSAVVALRVAMLCGCRPNELLKVKWENVDLDAGEIHVGRKQGRPWLVLGPQAVAELRKLAKIGGVQGWLVPSPKKRGAALESYRYVWGRLREWRTDLPKDVGPYVLRRTTGTEMRRLGIPIAHASAALGHSDTRVTERHYAIAHKEDAVAALAQHEGALARRGRGERGER